MCVHERGNGLNRNICGGVEILKQNCEKETDRKNRLFLGRLILTGEM